MFLSLLVLPLCACATGMKMTAGELRDLKPDEGLVLGSVRIRGGEDLLGRTGWKLVAEQAGGGPDYSIDADRDGDEEVFLTKMPAGNYHFFKLVGTGFSSAEKEIEIGFDVRAGKTAYVGRLGIEFPSGLITIMTPIGMRVEDAKQDCVDRAVKEYAVPLPDVVTGLMTVRSGEAPPLPPDDPPPASSFSVEFVPAGTEHYPPTEAKDVARFKNILHWPGQPDEVMGEVQSTTRPYVRVGELRFGQAWYYHSNIKELVDTHVPRVGGDAVLVYHAYQTSVAQVHLQSGHPEDVYFESIVLEVIRYTDR
jgi:hypothetical protein